MLFQSLLAGLAVLITWKVVMTLVWYVGLCRQMRKIPQKPGHWLFGNLPDLKDAKTYMDTIETMTKTQGIRMYCLWVGPFPFTGVTHPDAVKQVISQANEKAMSFNDGYRMFRPWLGDGLLISSGKKWKRNRRMLTPAFHFEILKGYVKVMNNCAAVVCDKLKDGTKDGQSVEIHDYFGRSTLDVMLKCALSFKGSVHDEETSYYMQGIKEFSDTLFKRLLNPILCVDWIFYLTSLGRREKKLTAMFHKFTGDLIAARKKELEVFWSNDLQKMSPYDQDKRCLLDFLDILLTAKDDSGKGLTDEEIQSEVDTFVFEGHDTTSSALSWAAYSFGKYPELQEKVYREVSEVSGEKDSLTADDLSKLPQLTLFIKETLRFYSPVPLIARQHDKPVVVDGVEIPIGPRIDIAISAIHHNPQIWKDQDEFRPERFENRDDHEVYGFVPFSAGVRNCIGQVFAMNELKITLATLVKRFLITLDHTKPTDTLPEIITRSTNGIWVHLKERGGD